jgi:hypothetical protein
MVFRPGANMAASRITCGSSSGRTSFVTLRTAPLNLFSNTYKYDSTVQLLARNLKFSVMELLNCIKSLIKIRYLYIPTTFFYKRHRFWKNFKMASKRCKSHAHLLLTHQFLSDILPIFDILTTKKKAKFICKRRT